MSKKEKILVTAALPYANGPVHVGHAIGAYIPADAYTRYHRLRGDDVVYICGTDEHGTPITVTADQEGITPKQVVEKYHDIQLKAFESIGIRFDNFSGTARPIHHKLSQQFFTTINNKGFIYEKTVERPYCPSCSKFLPDRYVKGTCPSCGSTDQRGDQCEACRKQLEPHELKDAYCSICRAPPEQRETTHWFFKLSEFSEELRKWIEGECRHWPANARNFALGWIREGLQDRAITRDLSWGVPVPVDGAEGKVLYVWFDAPIGYISSTREWSKKNWRKYWTSPTKIIHFIGKDNIPFHTIIWPAMLIAEGNYALPWQIASNEFLNLEGKKVSTSRGWVIWLHDITREFNPDAVRYYLLSIAPETNDSDFNLKEFQEKVNNELIATFGNFINRTLTFIQNKKGGIVPKPTTFDKEDDHFKENFKAGWDGNQKFVGEDLEKFHFKSALARLISRAGVGNQYFQKKEPWRNDPSTTLYLSVNLCRSLAILIYPFLPFSAEKIWKMIYPNGESLEKLISKGKIKWESAGELGIAPGHKIGRVEPLFEKIEDKKIEEFRRTYLLLGEKGKDKQQQQEEENKKVKHEGEKNMSQVDYTEFEKLELRVGQITAVSDHPNADKLYLLEADLGELGRRKLVAGIKSSYSKEELVGKKIIVVANLAPVKIRGIESKGMLLAADVSGKPVLLELGKDVPVGTKVR